MITATDSREAVASRTVRRDGGLNFSARLSIFERELSVAVITLGRFLDGAGVSEIDWSRLTLALHRVQAMRGTL